MVSWSTVCAKVLIKLEAGDIYCTRPYGHDGACVSVKTDRDALEWKFAQFMGRKVTPA